MNYSLIKSNIKGKESLAMEIWPSDSLEREYFNTLFSSETAIIRKPGATETILITPKTLQNESTTPGIEDKKHEESDI